AVDRKQRFEESGDSELLRLLLASREQLNECAWPDTPFRLAVDQQREILYGDSEQHRVAIDPPIVFKQAQTARCRRGDELGRKPAVAKVAFGFELPRLAACLQLLSEFRPRGQDCRQGAVNVPQIPSLGCLLSLAQSCLHGLC